MSQLSEIPLFYDNLSPVEKKFYDLYKANAPFEGKECFADYLNNSFRRGLPLPNNWALAATTLDSIISKNTFATDVTLWRATFDDFVAPYINDGVLQNPAYLSTSDVPGSLKRHFASTPGRIPVVLSISCKIGTTAAPMDSNPLFGDPEHELLLPRNSLLHIQEDYNITNKSEIEQWMGKLYSRGIQALRFYKVETTATG